MPICFLSIALRLDMNKLLFAIAMLFPLVSCAENDSTFYDGIHYTEINQVSPLTNTGKIEVVEVFWYRCPHCYNFEPKIEKWLETKPDDVEFVQVPGVLARNWTALAKVYYAAQALGVEEKMHPIIFRHIHKLHNKINTVSQAEPLFVANGVSVDDFRKKIRSFSVNTKVGQAKALGRKYGIKGVPTVIVDGKYRIDSGDIGSFDKVIDITNFLIKQIRQERAEKSK